MNGLFAEDMDSSWRVFIAKDDEDDSSDVPRASGWYSGKE